MLKRANKKKQKIINMEKLTKLTTFEFFLSCKSLFFPMFMFLAVAPDCANRSSESSEIFFIFKSET